MRWSRRYFGPGCEGVVQVGGFLEMWNGGMLGKGGGSRGVYFRICCCKTTCYRRNEVTFFLALCSTTTANIGNKVPEFSSRGLIVSNKIPEFYCSPVA